jgi:hypothetical protein
LGVGGLAVLEGQAQFQLGGDARAQLATEHQRVDPDGCADLIEQDAGIDRNAGARRGGEHHRGKMELALLEVELGG